MYKKSIMVKYDESVNKTMKEWYAYSATLLFFLCILKIIDKSNHQTVTKYKT